MSVAQTIVTDRSGALTHQVSLNMRVRGLGPSATIAINDRCRQLQAEGRTVFRLGLGQSPFPVPASVVDMLRRHAHEKAYQPAQGDPLLREAVADFHRRHDGFDSGSDDVLIGPGSKELMFLLQLVYYGELLVPTPCWVSYTPQARIMGRRVALIQTRYEDRWRITPEALEAHVLRDGDPYRPRLLIINYPGNPEGCTYTRDELGAIAEVSCRYGLIVLSDEIYGQLQYDGGHHSIGHYCPDRTIISSGLSKWCGAGGWRLGTFTFPPQLRWLLDAMTAVASETFTSVSAPIQCASVRAFHGGADIDDYLRHARRVLAGLGTWVAQSLQSAGVRVHQPEGGFYVFLDFSPFAEALARRGVGTSAELCEQLLADTGVAILPGSAFERPAPELTARLAFVDFNGEAALQASHDLDAASEPDEAFLERQCQPVIEATRRIGDWLKV